MSLNELLTEKLTVAELSAISMGSNRIQDVGAPSSDNDAVRKTDLDSAEALMAKKKDVGHVDVIVGTTIVTHNLGTKKFLWFVLDSSDEPLGKTPTEVSRSTTELRFSSTTLYSDSSVIFIY